ncbi:CmeU family protein [Campylobacter sp. US33a]|uniref:CmeU family protein n=1 Tax=Campylobacter sp. CCS1377 TaxID=3158229 RepID=A0AAU7E499_9BACT|nr:CmeU family protein [Campylobacter sp. US33a]MCW1360106.1 hypothetical protein [Campylobacter jejuni]TEY03495.1 hypothetical protein ELQ16_02780 [Campylobacter sp. US33a]
MKNKSEIIEKLNSLFKSRAEFYKLFDKHIPKINNTEVFDFQKAQNIDAKELYETFYHFDYAMRKLLPSIYQAYEIQHEDLDKNF